MAHEELVTYDLDLEPKKVADAVSKTIKSHGNLRKKDRSEGVISGQIEWQTSFGLGTADDTYMATVQISKIPQGTELVLHIAYGDPSLIFKKPERSKKALAHFVTLLSSHLPVEEKRTGW